MRKLLHVLNTKFIINAEDNVIDFVMKSIPNIEDNITLNTHVINYVYDEYKYEKLNKMLDNKKVIRFYGNEYKERQIIEGKIILVDENSVIINDAGNFTIIGKNEFSKRTIIYLIREAIYENYILNKDLVLHSAAIEKNGNGYSIIGHSGAGKTTLLMELIDKLNANYIANDILVVNNKEELIASILPLRIANGSISRFTNEEFLNLKEKKKYEIDNFTNDFSCELKTNVLLDKIILPTFKKGSSLEINEVSKDIAFELIYKQTMNIYDPVRPYMWVNEFKKGDVLKEYNIDDKIKKIIANHEVLSITYGDSIKLGEKKDLMRVLR